MALKNPDNEGESGQTKTGGNTRRTEAAALNPSKKTQGTTTPGTDKFKDCSTSNPLSDDTERKTILRAADVDAATDSHWEV